MAGTDNVEKGIRRGDAEVSLQALLRLPAGERAPFVEPVGALFRAAVSAELRAKNWSKLISWASRAEKLPGLEGQPGSPEGLATHWALTWGAIKTKEWERAARWYRPLGPLLAERSPGFAAAMEALVSGSATAEVVAPFLGVAPADDARLGHQPKRARLEWTAPGSAGEVEGTLLAMVGREPWAVFAAHVTQWAPKVDAATRAPMLVLAGQLAVREALKRAGADRAPAEPAELLLLAVEALAAPPALADEALLMFRVLAARVPAEVSTAGQARELALGARIAGAYEALRPVVIPVVATKKYRPEVTSAILRLIEHLVGQRLNVPLVGKALLLLSNADPAARKQEHRASPPLLRALTAAIASDPEALGRWLDEVTPPFRDNLAGWMSFLLPVEVLEVFIPTLWRTAAASRGELTGMVENVILRLREEGADPDDWLDEDADPLEGPLPARARPFWNAVRDLVLPEDLAFLPFALREAREERPLDLLSRALGARPPIEKLLRAWSELWDHKHKSLCRHVEGLVFELHGRDLHSLIHGVMAAQRSGLPLPLKRKLAAALRLQAGGDCDCPDRPRALQLADQWLEPPGARAKKPGKRGSPPADDDPIPF
jgi:hypothetical protein